MVVSKERVVWVNASTSCCSRVSVKSEDVTEAETDATAAKGGHKRAKGLHERGGEGASKIKYESANDGGSKGRKN